MKNIELINDSIQKMANKPSKEAIAAAQSIAKEMDDAMASGYEIEWWCWSINDVYIKVCACRDAEIENST